MRKASGNHNTDKTKQPGTEEESSCSAKQHIPSQSPVHPTLRDYSQFPTFAERQKIVCKMTLCPVELRASIKTKFSPVPVRQHFSGMVVHGTMITKLVDRGRKEALGGQTSPLEMERQVYHTTNVVFCV